MLNSEPLAFVELLQKHLTGEFKLSGCKELMIFHWSHIIIYYRKLQLIVQQRIRICLLERISSFQISTLDDLDRQFVKVIYISSRLLLVQLDPDKKHKIPVRIE
jgi:hypothetical protein